MVRMIPLLVILIYGTQSCVSSKNCTNCGIIKNKTRHYENTSLLYTAKSLIADFKIIYKDSLVIEVIPMININDSLGVKTVDTVIDHYLFIDLRNKIFCEYKNFSDTAKIIRYYVQPDSVEIRGTGGWRFYVSPDLPVIKPPERISDTLINNILFKRYKFINANSGNIEDIKIGYFRCDKIGTLFQFDKNFSKKVGCPMVRLDALPSIYNPNPVSSEIEFIKDKLTKEEMEVFKVWERSALKILIK